jgi:hypothetical protein
MAPAISDLKPSTLPIENELDGQDLFQQNSDNLMIENNHRLEQLTKTTTRKLIAISMTTITVPCIMINLAL